ncbi:alpha/beta hydrolase family protein [Hyphomonas sp.]|uniref:alpha/beta hydrolase family protein n=1 Tax=Hyphomonas sp. TaxID=87 RepID=UPI0030037F3C
MKTKILPALAVILAAALQTARADTNEIAELYGRAAGIASPQISPQGTHLAIECAPQGLPSLCVFDLTGGAEPALLGLDSTYRLKDFFWADEERLIFRFGSFERLQTQSGMQEFEAKRAVSYDVNSGESTMLMSDMRGMVNTSNIVSLLPQEKHKVLALGWMYDGGETSGTIMPTKSTGGWLPRTYIVDLKNGKSRKAETFPKHTDEVVFDQYGREVARLRRDTNLGTSTVYKGRDEIYSETDIDVRNLSLIALEESVGDLIVWIDRGENHGLNYMSLRDGAISPVMIGDRPASGAATIIDPYTRTLVGVEYGGEWDQQVFLVPELDAAQSAIEAAMPGKHVTITSWTADRSKVTVALEEAGRPADYFVYDSAAGTMGGLGSAGSHLVNRPVGNVISISYEARDGLTVPGFVTLPQGKTQADGPFPLVVLPHGGPFLHDTASFDWWSGAYAEAGYAVLRPNYRGSTGSSPAHHFAGYGEYGGKMVDDVIDGAAWAVAQGLANPGGYCIVGGSYGGYSALMVAARDAAQVKCAISVNGVTDPILRLADFTPKSDAYNEYEAMLGSGRFSDEASRAAIMPVRQVNTISANTLVMHGREDTRVPFRQFTQMRSEAGNRPNFTFVEMEGEDHFLQSTYARTDVLKQTLAFLQAHHPAQ